MRLLIKFVLGAFVVVGVGGFVLGVWVGTHHPPACVQGIR
jgi:hypothetical protein